MINLGNTSFTPNGATQDGVAPTGGVTLNLQKNAVLNLTKSVANPLTGILAGAGWDIAVGGADFDLDLFALLCREGADGKVCPRTGTDAIFFNNKAGKGISLSGDNRTGAGDGDDEQININTNQLDPDVKKISVFISIFD